MKQKTSVVRVRETRHFPCLDSKRAHRLAPLDDRTALNLHRMGLAVYQEVSAMAMHEQ